MVYSTQWTFWTYPIMHLDWLPISRTFNSMVFAAELILLTHNQSVICDMCKWSIFMWELIWLHCVFSFLMKLLPVQLWALNSPYAFLSKDCSCVPWFWVWLCFTELGYNTERQSKMRIWAPDIELRSSCIWLTSRPDWQYTHYQSINLHSCFHPEVRYPNSVFTLPMTIEKKCLSVVWFLHSPWCNSDHIDRHLEIAFSNMSSVALMSSSV